MTLDLGQGRSITVNSFHGHTWVCVSSNGGGTTVAMGDEDALAAAAGIIASVQGNRRKVNCPVGLKPD